MQRLPLSIEDALAGWVQAIVPAATPIWADQDGPRPDPPFVLLDVIAGPVNVGAAEERYKDEDTFTYGIRKRATLNLQFFGETALVMAGQVVDALELPSRQSLLQAAGIACWGAEGLRDITGFLDTAHEGRATVDLFISWPQPVDDVPGEIHRVHVTGTLGAVDIDQLIEVGE